MKTISVPPGKYSETKIELKVLGKIDIEPKKEKSDQKIIRKPQFQKATKAERFVIQIKHKGEKGSWWNKFIDNYFVAEKVGDTSEFKTLFLCDLDGNKVAQDGYERLKIEKEFIFYFKPAKAGFVK